jgi:hypothetical protein
MGILVEKRPLPRIGAESNLGEKTNYAGDHANLKKT